MFGVAYGLYFSGRGVALFTVAPAVCTYSFTGAITSTAEPSILTGSNFITPELVGKVLHRAKSEGCRALVLSVNSPGGEVAASHEIYKRFVNFRRETKVPVVVYMEGVVASGGYYISLGADHIVANPGTMTGSVGAVGTLISVKELLDKLGIDIVTVKSGEYKDVGNNFREIRDADIEFMRDLIDKYFEQFARLVKEVRGNKLNPAYEREIFNELFLGDEAFEAGLVDEVGTFEDAVAKARELSGLPSDAPVRELRVTTPSLFQLPISISAGETPLSPSGMHVLYIEPSHIAQYLLSTEVRVWQFQGP